MFKPSKISGGILSCIMVLALVIPMTFWIRTAFAQVMHQDLKQQYEQEQKDVSAANQTQNQNDDEDVEVGGPPPLDDYSTLSQQDADTILEAAKALEKENPELAKKLLDIGNE